LNEIGTSESAQVRVSYE